MKLWAGINVRMHIAETNDELTYDGETVTRGDSSSTIAYKAENEGLHIIAGEGEIIESLKITAPASTSYSK